MGTELRSVLIKQERARGGTYLLSMEDYRRSNGGRYWVLGNNDLFADFTQFSPVILEVLNLDVLREYFPSAEWEEGSVESKWEMFDEPEYPFVTTGVARIPTSEMSAWLDRQTELA